MAAWHWAGLAISAEVLQLKVRANQVYLWIAQRMMTGQLPQELQKLAKKIFRRSMVDGISMDGMEQRFHKFMADIPSFADLSEEQLQAAAQLVDQHRIKVREMKLG
ncbi:hypothetical protein [Xanthomonas oryzae]|uniref:hypothetical protein n=1 Tax=Xanthomonas oryzae TaxID=347 RepID=UPI00215D5876|nr:hypothetical protein [Xanthomonas oryzae]WFC26058.1 hypothetical protein PEV90_08395 [Xanthomonas oryzae pv. oryzae]WFC26107.1 hypothetical protein PEV90_08670 [Xanthomonas oryzae pv. oryzae]